MMQKLSAKTKAEYHEAGAAGREIIDWTKRSWRRTDAEGKRVVRWGNAWYILKHYWKWWLGLAIFAVLTALLSFYHKKIVLAFQPGRQRIVDAPASWLVPVALLIVLNIPPLFGNEVVLLLIGMIWGLGIGMAIATAGTVLGEVICFWLFKYYLTGHAKRLEEKNIYYGVLARLMREGGIRMICLIRFSAVPGHLVTAVQSTVGMPLWIYTLAVVVSLPKQLVVVYLGVLFNSTATPEADPAAVKRERLVSLLVLFITGIMTLIAMYFIWMRARRHYPIVEREYAERKAAKEALEAGQERDARGDWANVDPTVTLPGSEEDGFADVKLLRPGGRSEGSDNYGRNGYGYGAAAQREELYGRAEYEESAASLSYEDGMAPSRYDQPQHYGNNSGLSAHELAPIPQQPSRQAQHAADVRRMPTGGHFNSASAGQARPPQSREESFYTPKGGSPAYTPQGGTPARERSPPPAAQGFGAEQALKFQQRQQGYDVERGGF